MFQGATTKETQKNVIWGGLKESLQAMLNECILIQGLLYLLFIFECA